MDHTVHSENPCLQNLNQVLRLSLSLQPEKDWIPRYYFDERVEGKPHRHGYRFGWKVDFGVNAKNSFGGYAGEEYYKAFFENGTLRGIFESSGHKDIFGYPFWWLVVKVNEGHNEKDTMAYIK
jgi:hypothetical protein